MQYEDWFLVFMAGAAINSFLIFLALLKIGGQLAQIAARGGSLPAVAVAAPVPAGPGAVATPETDDTDIAIAIAVANNHLLSVS